MIVPDAGLRRREDLPVYFPNGISQPGSVLHAELYGCVGDDSTLNDTAIALALAAANTQGKKLVFGPGKFRLSARVEATFTNAVTIEGAGSSVTEFVWMAANGGFKFTFTNVTKAPEIYHIGLRTYVAAGGTALEIVAPTDASPLWFGAKVSHVAAWGISIATHYWDCHFKFVNCWYPTLEHFMFTGRNDYVACGIGGRFFASAVGINFENVQAGVVHGKMMASCVETGFLQSGASNGEGLSFCPDGEMISVRDGLMVGNAGGTKIGGFHLSSLRTGIQSAGHSVMEIWGILFLKSNISTDNYVGLDLNNAVMNKVHDNIFWGLYGGTGTLVPIFIRNYTEDCAITFNQGRDLPTGTVLIVIGSYSKNCNIFGNRVKDDCTVLAVGSDVGTGNIFLDNYPVPVDTMADGATTYSAKLFRGGILKTANTAPTTFTGFTGGFEGQRITMQIGDTNTSFAHSTALYLKGGAAVAAPANAGGFINLRCTGTVWFETSRSW